MHPDPAGSISMRCVLAAEQTGDPVLPLLASSVLTGVIALVSLRLWGGYVDVLRCRVGRPGKLGAGAHVSDDPMAEWRSLIGRAKASFYWATLCLVVAVVSIAVLVVRWMA